MIEQHLYSKEKVIKFKEYVVEWLLATRPDQVSKKRQNELLDKYNEVFGLKVGE